MKNEVLIAVVFILIGFYLGGFFNSQIIYITETVPERITPSPSTILNTSYLSNASVVEIKIPAVDDNGEGLITQLFVQAIPGSGKTLANIDNILFFTDTQNSIRTARSVAQNITGKDLSEYDLIYTIIANASVITGPSAGASLAVATVAALEGKEINPKVMMTGNLNHDGTIGPVGQIAEKTRAAQKAGAEIFLVPVTQASKFTFRTERVCETIGSTEFCSVETIPEKINITDGSGITIKEVTNINEVLEYFLID